MSTSLHSVISNGRFAVVPRLDRLAGARQPAGPIGFLLADLEFNALYANQDAMSILAFPETAAGAADFTAWAQARIRAIFNADRYTERIGTATFVSGRRRYLCQSLLLNATTRPAVGLLLQRDGNAPVDFAEVSRRFHLSPRETETIRHLVRGLTTKEAAERMSISPNTVKQFVRLIMTKMGVTTRSAIIGKLFNN